MSQQILLRFDFKNYLLYFLIKRGKMIYHKGKPLFAMNKRDEVYMGNQYKRFEIYNPNMIKLPYLTYNPFEEEQKIERDIVKIDYSEFKNTAMKQGLCIVAFLVGKDRWIKRQVVEYKIINYLSEREKRMRIMRSCPPEHYIEYDRINDKYRIVGKNVRFGKSQWK